MNLKVLELLKEQYPNVQAATTELINLSAILNLPKGTESFIADIHGEFDAYRTGTLKESYETKGEQRNI